MARFLFAVAASPHWLNPKVKNASSAGWTQKWPKNAQTNLRVKKCCWGKIWVQPAEPKFFKKIDFSRLNSTFEKNGDQIKFLEKPRLGPAQLEMFLKNWGSTGSSQLEKKIRLNQLDPHSGWTFKLNRLNPNFGKMTGGNPHWPVTRTLGVEPAEPRGLQRTIKWNKNAWIGHNKTGVEPPLIAVMRKIDRNESISIRIVAPQKKEKEQAKRAKCDRIQAI